MIEDIRNNMKKHINGEIKVISKENRNRNDIFYGNLSECYSHIFVVRKGSEKKSYSYADVLSKDIVVSFL